jgi:hypothetical protein
MIRGRVCKKDIEFVKENFLYVDGVYVDLETVLFREYEINNEHFRVIFFMGLEPQTLLCMENLTNDEDYICMLNQYLDERENRYKFNEILKAKQI